MAMSWNNLYQIIGCAIHPSTNLHLFDRTSDYQNTFTGLRAYVLFIIIMQWDLCAQVPLVIIHCKHVRSCNRISSQISQFVTSELAPVAFLNHADGSTQNTGAQCGRV